MLQALEGTLTVEIRPSNAVVSIAIEPGCIPSNQLPAGSSLDVSVRLETEDQRPLSLEDAHKGLRLSLIAPGANSKAAHVCCRCAMYSVHSQHFVASLASSHRL